MIVLENYYLNGDKVQIFWEDHKIWHYLPQGLAVAL